ncbi:unnamed protein product [Mytilus coruscus]|uniref:Uncharacterized protein n=1 Tax=Mytilus coruscus TaxID=42192 RepID=A0A6J8EFN5_MYTCO|nr:unnamed protein product [Mytilus coruscus]
MSGRSSCSKLHPERRPGPCAYCNNDHISNRYIHLIQKVSDLPDFTNFVSSKYKIAELDCICRKCEDADGCTSSDIHHYTEINVPVFEKAFSVSMHTQFPEHSTIVEENLKCIDDNKRLKKESIIQAEKMASTVSAESRKNKQEQSLEDAVQILKNYVKIYVSDKIKMDRLPDIDNFKYSFIVASFDNLDKNQAYSVVCAGKDRSGFHGTTIQTVVPKPSQKINMFDDSSLISNLNQTNIKHDISEVKNSIDRKLEKNIIQKLVNPEDKFGLPPVKKQNKFSNMSPSDLDETSAEISEWDEFYTIETTEKSDFSSVAIPDETADSKETVLKVLNILNDKFQVGQLTNYVVVVGDGKSYDHLIKLKSEYGETWIGYLPTLVIGIY